MGSSDKAINERCSGLSVGASCVPLSVLLAMLTSLTLALPSVIYQRSPHGAEPCRAGRSCDAPALEGSRIFGSEAPDITFFQGAQARSVAAAGGGAVAALASPGSRAISDEGLGSSGLLVIGSRAAAVRDELLAVH